MKKAMTEERNIKHRRVREYLASHELDAVLLARRCNFSWYACGAHNYVAGACDVGNSYLLVQPEGATVLADNIEAERMRAEEFPDGDIEVIDFPYHDAAARAKTLAKATAKMRVAADAPIGELDAEPLERDFDPLRWTLTEWEIQRYRALAADTAAAVESAARAAKPGQTENAIAGALGCALIERNCNPWLLLVGADERIERFRHPLPTEKPARKYVMLVACSERDGLIVSCTRIAAFGPISDELAEKHRAVCAVDSAVISATRPGATLGELFSVMQDAYAREGFGDEWRLHHQGGSCGYLPRELKATPGETTKVLADQAFAWNPSITGTKSEDTVICRAGGTAVMAGATDWPMITVEHDGLRMDRPAILTP